MRHQNLYPYLAILFAALVLTGCGGARQVAPTAPQATPSPFPTYNFVPPTQALNLGTEAVGTQSASGAQAIDPELVKLGKGRYDALDCGSCHGADAKGTDKGKALVPNKLTQDQFIDFLRSGGKLGNAHLYSTNRLSETGGKNLYLYIVSLSAGS